MINHLFEQLSDRGTELVMLNSASSSLSLETGIWLAQHQTVAEEFVEPTADDLPDAWFNDNYNLDVAEVEAKAAKAIIKHQLGKNIGHYSVLNFGFISFAVCGFDHNTMAQWRTHSSSHMLVQSMRYTGKRVVDLVAAVKADEMTWQEAADKIFYTRPVGVYQDRFGSKFEQTEDSRLARLLNMWHTAVVYAEAVAKGEPMESARGLLSTDFRQHWYYASTIRGWFHALDQRSKADAQPEASAVAYMMLEASKELTPVLAEWYLSNRAGKAILAP